MLKYIQWICLEGNKDNKNLFKEADEMADYLIGIWEGFCDHISMTEL